MHRSRNLNDGDLRTRKTTINSRIACVPGVNLILVDAPDTDRQCLSLPGAGAVPVGRPTRISRTGNDTVLGDVDDLCVGVGILEDGIGTRKSRAKLHPGGEAGSVPHLLFQRMLVQEQITEFDGAEQQGEQERRNEGHLRRGVAPIISEKIMPLSHHRTR